MARIVEGIAFVQSHTMHFPASLFLAHVMSIYDTTLTLMTPPLSQHYPMTPPLSQHYPMTPPLSQHVPYQLGKLLLNLQSPHQSDFLCNATPFLLSKL